MLNHLAWLSNLFAHTRSRQEFLDHLVEEMQILTAMDCVGIRVLNADGTLPYEAYVGFSREFWESENCLCIYNHQCVCIRSITGEMIPMDAAILSARSSIWANDLQGFGKAIPPALLPEYRGKCIGSGFQTLGVITLHSDGQAVGLLHLADVRPDRLPAATMALLEGISNAVGAVIRRFIIEDHLRAAQRAAEEANSAKTEFLANTSHEIRTPMTVVIGVLEYLSLVCSGPNELKMLRMAEHSAQRLLSLINEILDISRIEAGRMELRNQSFDLHDAIGKAVHLFDLKAAEKGLDLAMHIDPEVPKVVLGDGDRLAQILVNLIGNAVKFTECGGVTVKVEPDSPDAKQLRFSVQDTGIGIPADKLALVFESFRQVDVSMTRNQQGAGLGLAISRGLAALMGGDIRVHSIPGEGSSFFFVLPLPEATDNPASAPKHVMLPQ